MSLHTVRLAAAALVAAAAPAAAQQLAPAPVAPVAAPAAASRTLTTLAVYRFAASGAAGLPAEVTVADSAGSLVASYRLPGERAPRPLVVEVLNTDLVLQGFAPAGLLTLRLAGQNDPSAAPASLGVTGDWWLGDRRGTLHGRTLVAAR